MLHGPGPFLIFLHLHLFWLGLARVRVCCDVRRKQGDDASWGTRWPFKPPSVALTLDSCGGYFRDAAHCLRRLGWAPPWLDDRLPIYPGPVPN